MNKTAKPLLAIIALPLVLALPGCAAPVLVAGAAGAAGAAVATDKRTPTVVLEDQSIEFQAAGAIRSDPAVAEKVHVSATCYNHVLLLTGQAPSAELRARVVASVKGIPKVRQIHDEIEIAPPVSIQQRGRDTLTTTKVKSTLLGEKGLHGMQIKVVTEDNVVYLMGLARRSEARQAAELTRRIDGVARVVTVFEYLD